MSLTLSVENGGKVLARASGEALAESDQEATLVYGPEYRPGDTLVVASDAPGRHLLLQLEDTIPPALVYLKGTRYALPVPFGEKRVSYSPRSFTGERHVLAVRPATPEEVAAPRNLALNPLDSHGNSSLYPHASANVETRGEAVFAARNAIDGCKANTGHGEWPYQSWGINRDPEAELRLAFGRPVVLTHAVVYLRADFPHDAWWQQATLDFSDGSREQLPLKKTHQGQRLAFAPRRAEWVLLHRLIKAADPSPFPALTQLELYGTEIL